MAADSGGAFTVGFQVLKVRPTSFGGSTFARGSASGDCVITALQQSSGRRAHASLSFAKPPVVVECAVGSGSVPVLTVKLTAFPANETFLFLTVVATIEGGLKASQGHSVTTDTSGGASISVVGADGVPAPVGFAIYRDRNPNSVWDFSDDTLFHGDATVTACPQTVTVAPK